MRLSVAALIATLALFAIAAAPARAADESPTRKVVYKTVGDTKLSLHIFEPKGHKAGDKTPGIVFFFGGGWVGGSPSQFYPHCAYLASRGMWAAAAEYRTKKSNGTDPRACVADGKSAMRYVRAHASELGVDPDKLAAGGGSAGGHVAATTATITKFDEEGEDTSVSPVPNALCLFNAVYDNGPDGYGYDRVKDYWQDFSPLNNIRKGMPPAIVFLGTKDALIPVATAEKFKAEMEKVGSRSELMLFEGQGHGFFNKGKGGDSNYTKTVIAMDRFLASLGFLTGEPTLEEK
ncbi:MAG: alpha/beta hydrolase fold domain-containing protein [Phycisphaera sp.]|nr:alpha/beta hydrolase fold domain-containing protein [Phycisphaera sp.]